MSARVIGQLSSGGGEKRRSQAAEAAEADEAAEAAAARGIIFYR
jgi:hypothetical protein